MWKRTPSKSAGEKRIGCRLEEIVCVRAISITCYGDVDSFVFLSVDEIKSERGSSIPHGVPSLSYAENFARRVSSTIRLWNSSRIIVEYACE